MKTGTNWKRLAIFALLGILIGGGAAAFFIFFRGGPARTIARANATYRKGAEALESGDPAEAARLFEQARLQADQAIDTLEKERLTTRGDTPEEKATRETLLGQGYWIKTQALRDEVFAQKKQEGAPLILTLDSTKGDMFRSLLVLPDPKVRDEAMRCLRMAAHWLPKDLEVQRESLRAEVMLSTIAWGLVEQRCENIIAKEPHDTRANYQLAQFHFEQPVIDAKGRVGGPLASNKRSVERMLKARGYLDAVKKSPDHKFWRTRDLETQVAIWLRDEYERQSKSEKREQEEKTVRRLLFDDKEGATAKAAADPKLPDLTVYDLKAALNLHHLAVKETIRAARTDKLAAARVPDLVASTLDLSAKASAKKDSRSQGEAAEGALVVVAEARPFLPDAQPQIDMVRKLARQAIEMKDAGLELYAKLARFLQNEARVAGKRGKEAERKALESEIDTWIAEGLAEGRERKLPDARMLDLLAVSAERKALHGKAVKEELDALRKTKSPEALALANFLEGVLHYRTGRLDRARKLFEESDQEGTSLRTNLALSQVYLALGQSDKALQRLRRVTAAYSSFEGAAEQDWILEFLPSPEELTYMTIAATLGQARMKVQEYLRANRTAKTIPAELVAGAEKEARAALEKLPPGSHFRQRAQTALVRHYISLRNSIEARLELKAALKEQEPNIEMLQLELAVVALEAGGDGEAAKKKVEERLQTFLKDNPEDVSGRLLWATWLLRTNRADEAVKYLESVPAKDDRHRHVLALALLGSGKRDEGIKLLQHLPSTPEIDAMLVRLADNEKDRAALLEKALSRHERNGLLHVLNAGESLTKKKFEEAARRFYQALEYDQVRSTAERGLLQAAFNLANEDPAKARKMAGSMIDETPLEKIPYLCFAYASLQLDELGLPGDSWERSRSMATALNVWEQLQRKGGADPTSTALTRAEFWNRAGRPDLAHAEVRKAYDPKNAAVVELLVQLSLDAHASAAQRDQGRKHLELLKTLKPAAPALELYEARMLLLEKKNAEAVKHLEKMIADNPKAVDLRAFLVGHLLGEGDAKAAAPHIAAWQKLAPEESEPVIAGIIALALEKDLPSARKNAEEFIAGWLKRAEKKALEAKWDPAIKADEKDKRLKDFLTNVEIDIRWRLARAFQRGNAPDEAHAEVKKLFEIRPDLEAALILRGELEMAAKDWKAAAKTYETILAKNAKNFVAGNNLAYLLAERLGEPDRAMKMVEKLRRGGFSDKPISGDRLRLEFLDTIGSAYLRSKSDVHADMKQLFEDARRRYPSDPRLALYLGHAYANLGNVAQARDALSASLTLATGKEHSLTADERDQVIRLAEEAKKKLEKMPTP